MVDIRREGVDRPTTLPTEMIGLVAFVEVAPGVFEPAPLGRLGDALKVINQSISSAARLPNNTVDGYLSTANGWKRTLVTAGAGVAIGADGEPVLIGAVRVAGTVALGGACTVASGTIAANTAQETIPSGSAPGVALDYLGGTEFADGCVVTIATSGTALVLWRPMQ